MESLVEEEASKIKKELKIENSPTPVMSKLENLLNFLGSMNIDESFISDVLEEIKNKGTFFSVKFKIKPKENSIYAIVPPFILKKDTFLEKIFGRKIKEIEERDKDKLAILGILAPHFFRCKIERDLPYTSFHLNVLEKGVVEIGLERFRTMDKRYIEVYSDLVSTIRFYRFLGNLLSSAYYFKKIFEVNEKYFKFLNFSPNMLSFFKEFNHERVGKYFSGISLVLEYLADIYSFKFQGKYRGEKCVNYTDFFKEEESLENYYWLLGRKRRKSFYL